MPRRTPDTSPRGLFMAQLQPLLPKDWKLVKYERVVDEITQITVKVKQQNVDRMKEAPGFYLTQSVLELVAPETDPEKAEDTLDQALFDFLFILQSINGSMWQPPATKVLDPDSKRLAYDVIVKYQTIKEQ